MFGLVGQNIGISNTHPVSSTLRPYVEQNHYESFKVNYDEFLRLCKIPPRLAALIKSLLICHRRRDGDEYRVQDEFRLLRFFESAISLKLLELCPGVPALQYRILSAKFSDRFASLESLTISTTGEDSIADYSRCLRSFTQLRVLTINLWVYDDAIVLLSEDEVDRMDEVDRLILMLQGSGQFLLRSSRL